MELSIVQPHDYLHILRIEMIHPVAPRHKIQPTLKASPHLSSNASHVGTSALPNSYCPLHRPHLAMPSNATVAMLQHALLDSSRCGLHQDAML